MKINIKDLPTAASFLVTEDCNLKCTYCFEKHKKNYMKKDVVRKGIKFLADNAKKIKDETGKSDGFSALIFGGEPTLAPDAIDEICRVGFNYANKYNISFSAQIVTNATIMTDKLADIIRMWRDKVNLSVQLSVDGVKEAQDMYRITNSGNGSFDLVEKTIPKFKELYKERPKMLHLHACVNSGTLPYMFETYKFFREEWGIPRIWFLPIAEEAWTDEDVEIYREEMEKIYQYIAKTVRETKSMDEVKNFAPIDRCMNPVGQKPSAPCGAGKHFISFCADGTIYGCHQLYFNDDSGEMAIGHLDDTPMINESKRRVYLEYDNSSLSCPTDCSHDNCYRCIAANYVKNGSLFEQIRGRYCEMMRIDEEYQHKMRELVIDLGMAKRSQLYPQENGNSCSIDSSCGDDCQCGNGDGSCGDNGNSHNRPSRNQVTDNQILAKGIKQVMLNQENIKNELKEIKQMLNK
mgnify:CR=1 FL=1